MSDQVKIKNSTLRLVKGDITNMEIDSFVYYARNDLSLGSGFGNAIAQRGGPSIQEALKKLGTIATTEVVITPGGNLKAAHILHAAGPKFQEPDLQAKLKATVINCLKVAEEKGLRGIAFPAMGVGFYGVPLDVSADITIGTVIEHLTENSKVAEVVITLIDNREYQAFKARLAKANN